MRDCLFVGLILFGLCSTMLDASSCDGLYTPSPHMPTMHRYSSELANKMEESGLRCISTGGSAMDGIRRFALGFQVQGYPTVTQARELAVAMMDTAHDLAIGDKELEGYLIGPPFQDKHIQMCVTFEGPKKEAPVGFVCGVGVSESVSYLICQDALSADRKLHTEPLGVLRKHVRHLSVREALAAIPKTRAEASEPFWDDSNFEEISGGYLEYLGKSYTNPKYHMNFARDL